MQTHNFFLNILEQNKFFRDNMHVCQGEVMAYAVFYALMDIFFVLQDWILDWIILILFAQ